MKSLREVLHDIGLSYYTLFKYSGLGLLPRPQRVWRGRKGSESWYPDDIIDTINRIKGEQESGLSLRQIVEKQQSEKFKWATDVCAALENNYPGYDITGGEITEIKDQPDGSLIVIVKALGIKRR
jgi:DNA-binding transcriptional MerR regulator